MSDSSARFSRVFCQKCREWFTVPLAFMEDFTAEKPHRFQCPSCKAILEYAFKYESNEPESASPETDDLRHCVCPRCNGSGVGGKTDQCLGCEGAGYLTRKVYEQLDDATKAAMWLGKDWKGNDRPTA